MNSDVIIVGGGASGMMCAIGASRNGKSVTLIEKNEKLGKKLFITGKGRCNITNIAEREEFFENIVTNPRFLYSSFSMLNNHDVIDIIEQNGVKTKVERGGRVFPNSDKSSDVIKALTKEIKKGKVNILLNTKVLEVLTQDNQVIGVKTNKGTINSKSVVIATGGKTYSSTGSTGDGYEFAKALGHNIKNIVPSLVPIECSDNFLNELQGLTLKNVSLICNNKNKNIFSEQGEMLFSHFGITGPLVLTLSAILGKVDFNDVELFIDLKPALDEETLDRRLLRDIEANKNKHFKSIIEGLMPRTLAGIVCKRLNDQEIDVYKQCNSISKNDRKILIYAVKHFNLTPTQYRKLEYAIVTKGGIDTKEVNPKTLESKKICGLYFVGEVLDVDAKTGGYNLQIAFSTGYAAGINC